MGISGSYVGQCYDAGDFVHYTLSELETCTYNHDSSTCFSGGQRLFSKEDIVSIPAEVQKGLIHGLPGHLTRDHGCADYKNPGKGRRHPARV